MRATILFIVIAASISTASASNVSPNAADGKAIFAAQCSACHSVVPGQGNIGPNLARVYGEKAANIPGYAFSPALKAAHIIWTATALKKFLLSPQMDVPGTKMPFMGMRSTAKRADIVAYLASLRRKGG
jgi:cytochrome c